MPPLAYNGARDIQVQSTLIVVHTVNNTIGATTATVQAVDTTGACVTVDEILKG